MVVGEKPNGNLRICLDPQHLNKAIKREHYQLPTIENITTRMANAKVHGSLSWMHTMVTGKFCWMLKVNC